MEPPIRRLISSFATSISIMKRCTSGASLVLTSLLITTVTPSCKGGRILHTTCIRHINASLWGQTPADLCELPLKSTSLIANYAKDQKQFGRL